MNKKAIMLNSEQLNKFFPFYILLNQNLEIESAGKQVQKLCSLQKKQLFTNAFCIKKNLKTITPGLAFSKTIKNKLFTLESLSNKNILLRGEFELINNSTEFLFIGTPYSNRFNSNKKPQPVKYEFTPVVPNKKLLLQTNYIIGSTINYKNNPTENFDELQRLALVAKANESGVIFTDAKGEIFWANEGFCKITGYAMEEIIGKTPVQLCKGSLSDREIMRQMVDAFYSGQSFNVELIHYRKDGSWFWGNTKGQCIFDEEGKILQYFSLIEDVTQKKEMAQNAQKLLRLREEKYRGIIANMNLGLMEVDTNQIILYANQSFCDMCGYNTDELIGKKASLLFMKEQTSELLESKNEARKRGISDAYEVVVKNKNGEWRWWLISGAPLYDDEAQLVGSIGIHLDITEQKYLEMELIEARENAEQSSRSKESFLANMSHEIRTPMNAILGMANQMVKTPLESTQLSYLKNIISASDHLLVIINDILDLSKIQAGKLNLEKIGFEPKLILEKTLLVLAHKAEEKGLALTNSRCDKDLSPVLVGDPHRLSQILLNILSNAIKFTEKGNVNIRCTLLKDSNTHQLVLIEVIDTGIGMDENFSKNLFKKFSQENDSTTRKYGGTGLGMNICKELVELMGGQIKVESKKGYGTKVSLFIEFEKGTVNDLPVQESLIPQGINLTNKKILVVDDVNLNRLVAATILKHYGTTILEAENGRDAIHLIKNNIIDLILMDVQMPEMDGYETTEYIRKNISKKIPIIALTANATKEDNDKCLASGMNAFISKPFKEKELLLKINTCLKNKNIQQWPRKKITNDKHTASLYNISNIKDISQGNDDFVVKIVKMFIEQTPIYLEDIRIKYISKDFEGIEFIAHKMKSAIDNMGIQSLKQPIRALEKLAKEKTDNPLFLQLLKKIETDLVQVIEALIHDFEKAVS